jgi:hypothetical protein
MVRQKKLDCINRLGLKEVNFFSKNYFFIFHERKTFFNYLFQQAD